MSRAKLVEEQMLGSKAEHSYKQFIAPFIKVKREALFKAFQEVSISNKDDLMEIKRMSMTLNGLETEIQTIIDTGKLATEMLHKEEER